MRLQPAVLDVRRVRDMLADGDAQAAGEIALALSPPDLAELLMQLGPIELSRLQPYLGIEQLGDAVAELDPSEAARLIASTARLFWSQVSRPIARVLRKGG